MAPDMIGFGELVEMLGVGRSTAARYTHRPDFPKPVEKLAGGRIWSRSEVRAWEKQNLPKIKPGRPRKPSPAS